MVNEDFEQFVAMRYGDLLHTAYLLTGSTDRAEDLVQGSGPGSPRRPNC